MATTVIDWVLKNNAVANTDGSRAAVVVGAVEVPGPGATALGLRPTALRFGAGASCKAQVSPGWFDATRLTVRVSFRVTAAVTKRGNLLESTALPFSLFVDAGAAPDRFNVVASVANGAAGWSTAHSSNRVALVLNQWYVASLVYDNDTLALLVDDQLVAVSAFARGGLQAPSGDLLVAGTWVDGVRWPLPGEIAGVQVWNGIPGELEAKLDAERGGAEWHLTRKESELRPTLNLGPKSGDYYFDSATLSWVQPYALAVISFTESHGAAFVMYGAILAKWRSDEQLRRALGALASDEIAGRRAGSRKSVFSQGCIYWSPQTHAMPVLERLYLDFELLGEGASAIGLPTAEAVAIAGGKVQQFQGGRMYWRNGAANAFEVHGAILAKYDAAGGPGRYGFPLSHECDVLRGSTGVGKFSEFERCTIYWSPRTPASIVYGGIRDRYRGTPSLAGEGGPLGDLGFPTSDESDIPGAAGARHNTFEHGSILWFSGECHVCRPFSVALGRLDTKEEDRDILDLDGQNDLYCRVCVDVNGGRVFDRKYPESSTHFASANIRDLNINVPYTVTPNAPVLTVKVTVQVWESDSGQIFGGGDAHLGTMTAELNMANAWGLRNNNGLFRASNFGPWVNYLDWSVKQKVTPRTPLDFFGVTNDGTPTIDWREYGAAFSDVDPDFELDFGLIDDGLKALFYETVVKGVAAGGNCFGMCLEAIYAWKDRSRLGRPLANYTNWKAVENDFNVKHAYQVGADAIWWMVGQFLGGNTHDPVSVFQATWDAYNRGENPVVCISQNYDFSGAPHCILPIEWNRNGTPWQITFFDPNFPNQRRIMTVDPVRNRFRYDGSSNGSRIYTGDAWSGGRFHYMPWGVLNHQQRTPVWDAALLALGGLALIFGDSTEVGGLVDEKGNRLDAGAVHDKDSLAGKLLRVPGVGGLGPVKGAFYLGRQQRRAMVIRPEVVSALRGTAATSALTSVARTTSLLRSTLSVAPAVRLPVATEVGSNQLSGPALMDLARRDRAGFVQPTQPTDLDTIRASLRGKAAGTLQAYLKRGLMGTSVRGDVAVGEAVQMNFEKLGSRANELQVQSDRSRRYNVTLAHKLGAGKDFLKLTLNGVANQPNQALRMNVQPGLGTVDILSGGSATPVQLTVEGVVGGKPVKSGFNTVVDGGQRLSLPDLADPSHLKVGKIEQLQGGLRDVKMILRN